MRHLFIALLAFALLVAEEVVFPTDAVVLAAESLVTNGDFQKWTNGIPDGWQLEIGATNGAAAPKSEVALIKGPALMLRGDASTMAWHAVSQKIAATPGGSYRLEFEARVKDVKREGQQYDNCYAGVTSFDISGKRVGMSLKDLSGASAWQRYRIDFQVPLIARKTQVVIFLSKTGTLAVKNVSVQEATPERPSRGSR